MQEVFCSVRFHRSGPPLGEATIAQFEGRLPGPLPEDYFRFLCNVNGGEPQPCGLPLPEKPTPIKVRPYQRPARIFNLLLADIARNAEFPRRIEKFHPLSDPHDGLEYVNVDTIASTEPDASSLMRIASDTEQRGIYLSLADEAFGSVYDADTEVAFGQKDDPPTKLEEMEDRRLANSFTDLLKQLTPPVVRFRKGFHATSAHWRLVCQQGFARQ